MTETKNIVEESSHITSKLYMFTISKAHMYTFFNMVLTPNPYAR